jgi:hypothetical protein
MNKKNIVIILVVIAVVVVVGFFWWWHNSQPGKLDDFAKCLKDRGEKFYGAFWCPHCQNQKSMFGSSKKYLPYIECSTPDGNNQIQLCNNENIKVYPTWKFHDGTVGEGELSLQELSEKSGCQLPQ